jgi:hypothetical protein
MQNSMPLTSLVPTNLSSETVRWPIPKLVGAKGQFGVNISLAMIAVDSTREFRNM